MSVTQVRVDTKNFNDTVPQSVSSIVEDVARGKIYVLWAGRGTGADNSFHNREILFCAVDRASKTPGSIVVVEADAALDLDALQMLLMADGTIVVAYGMNGVRVRESTDGGATWSAGIAVDGAYGASSRLFCLLMGSLDGTLAQVVTQEQSGGNTDDLYLSKRTGAATWDPVRKIHDAASAGASPFFDFTVSRAKAGRNGVIVDANHAYLVADYSNASAALDQVRALYTTDGWTTSATSLVHDYTGTGASRNPCAVHGADGIGRTMWVAAGVPVFSTTADNGATWTAIGTPTPLSSLTWGVRERFFALDAGGLMYAGVFESAATLHIFSGGDSLSGWVDNPATGLSNIANTAGVGDGLLDSEGSLWRVYTRLNGGSGDYEVWLLAEGDAVIEAPVPPEVMEIARGNVILATISLPAYGILSALTLHLSNRPYVDGNGLRWDPLIRESPAIDHGGGYLQTDVQIVDAVLTLLDGRITAQAAAGARLSTLLASYPFEGARCHIQQGFVGDSTLYTLLDGEIAELDSRTVTTMALHVTQDRKFDVLTPPRTVNATDDPLAPTDSFGQRKQIAFGDWSTDRETDSIFGSPMALWGVGRGAMPLLPVTMPSHGALQTPKYHVSDRQLKAVMGTAYIYEASVNTLAFTNDAPTEVNPDGGPETLQLATREFILAVPPIDPTADDTTDGYGTLFATDKPRDLSGYAVLDYDAGHILLALKLPDLSSLGDFVSAGAQIAYAKNAWGAPLGRWGISAGAFSGTIFATEVSNTFPAGGVSLPVTTPTAADAISASTSVITSWADLAASKLFVQLKAAGQKIQIHRIVVTVHYKPSADVIKPAVVVQRLPNVRTGQPGATVTTRQESVRFAPNMAGFPKGVPDEDHTSGSADGFYTGSVGALIENPVDLAAWVLRELGGVAEGEITTSATAFGNFAAARARLAGYKVFGEIADGQKVSEFLKELGSQTLCWFLRTPTEPLNPWIAVPWEVARPVNYRSLTSTFTFKRKAGHISRGSFSPVKGRVSAVRNVVRVNYDFDPRTGTYADQLYITGTASRVYSGGAFTTDATRVATSAASVARVGAKEQVLNLRWIKDKATASSILTRYHDLMALPKPTVRFETYVNAYDLNRGHVIQFSSDWDALWTFPREGSDGSWAGKALRVVALKRLKGSVVRYAGEAVEV